MSRAQYSGSTIVAHHDGREVPRHFVDNWHLRSPTDVQVDWRTAWDLSCPVGCESIHGQTRLYSPGDTLLIAKSTAFKTAFDKTNRELNTDHLKVCDDCENYWDPARFDGCQWCSHDVSRESC